MVTNSRMPVYNTTMYTDDEGITRVIHFQTCIVEHDAECETICFNTDGWHERGSPTTKQRINIYLMHYAGLVGWRCYQRNYMWYINTRSQDGHINSVLPFTDKMIVNTRTGQIMYDPSRSQRLYCDNKVVDIPA